MSDVYSVDQQIGGGGFNLTQKISGVTRLSPKIIKVLFAAGGVLFLLLMFAVDSIDDPNTSKKKEVDKSVGSRDGRGGETLPVDLMKDVGDGVPSALTNLGPTPILGASAAPAVPGPSAVPQVEGPKSEDMSNDKAIEMLAEKRRKDLERARESSGIISGFTDIVPPAQSSPAIESSSVLEAELAAMKAASNPEQEQDDQNKQVRKEKYLQRSQMANDDGYLNSARLPQMTPYEIKAGAIIPAVLKSAITSDLPGLIRAIVTDDVYDSSHRHILVPRGSGLIGTYDSQIAYGQRRLLAVWTKLIFPDGSTMAIKGMPGADQEGRAGLSGEVDNHYLRIFGAALASSVISAGYQLSQGGSSVMSSTGTQTPGQTMASALGQQLGQAGTAITTKNLNLQPSLTNPVGQRFVVNITKDMVFDRPYK